MQIKGRLFTIGCSYTKYDWPTYADFLGVHYKEFYNLGKAGAGNSYIFITLAQLLSKVNLTPEDCIIVQFSAISRYDDFRGENWVGSPGNIFNQNKYSQEWLDTYFSLEKSTLETISYIEMTKRVLSGLECSTVLLWMLNPNIHKFLGEPYNNEWRLKTSKDSVKYAKKILDKYKNVIDTGFLDDGIGLFQLDYKTQMYNNNQTDTHPCSLTHISYAEKIKREQLQFLPDFNLEHHELALEWTKYKSSLETCDIKNQEPKFPSLRYDTSKWL